MIIKSLDKFNEIQAEINNSKVGSYVSLLKEELLFYRKALERAKLLENSFDVAAAKARITIIEDKLRLPIRLDNIAIEGIDETALLPLGQQVWSEGESYLAEYQNLVSNAWNEALKQREIYLESIKKIGELRNESGKVASQMNAVCLTLRKNPMKMIQIGRLDPFIIDYNSVEKCSR